MKRSTRASGVKVIAYKSKNDKASGIVVTTYCRYSKQPIKEPFCRTIPTRVTTDTGVFII